MITDDPKKQEILLTLNTIVFMLIRGNVPPNDSTAVALRVMAKILEDMNKSAAELMGRKELKDVTLAEVDELANLGAKLSNVMKEIDFVLADRNR
jgi:hypothetical protein